MGGMPMGTIEELGRERRAELVRLVAAGRRRRPARPPMRRRALKVAGRMLVAAGQRLAGPEGAGGTRPVSA